MSLESETKTAMGYVECAGTCEICKFILEEDDKFVERSWTTVCTFSNLIHFAVSKGGTCDKFMRKTKK